MNRHFQEDPAEATRRASGSQAMCLSFAANELRAAAAALFTAAEDDRRDLNDPARRRFLKEAHRRAVTAISMLD